MSSRVLVIDDEPSMRSLLNGLLLREGFHVFFAADGREGLKKAGEHRPDLIILDLNLPDLDGEEVCQGIRQTQAIENTPILILTGKDTRGLTARCLNMGADDYLSKPFDLEEILARVKALVRRGQGLVSRQGTVAMGQITVHTSERMVLWKGRRTPLLAPKEFEMLRLLVREAPRVVDKKTLAAKVWGVPLEELHQRTMDVHIRRIRKKLGPAAAACLKTVPAVGFQWLDESISPPAAEHEKR